MRWNDPNRLNTTQDDPIMYTMVLYEVQYPGGGMLALRVWILEVEIANWQVKGG